MSPRVWVALCSGACLALGLFILLTGVMPTWLAAVAAYVGGLILAFFAAGALAPRRSRRTKHRHG